MRLASLQSLRIRLLIVLLGLAALPALMIGALAYRNARQSIEERVVAQLTAIADLKKEQITTWLDGRADDARLLADNFLTEEHFTEILDPRTDPQRSEAFAGFLTDNLRGIQKARVGYREIFFVDVQGKVILSTNEGHLGMRLAAYAPVAKTLHSPTGEFIEDIYRDEVEGDVEMAFGHVLHAVDLKSDKVLSEINGAVIIKVQMDETIYPLIRSWPGRGRSGETLLVRGNGGDTLFLNPLRFKPEAALNFRVPADSDKARVTQLSAMGNEGITETNDYRGVPVLAAFRSIPQTGWGFVAKQDMDEAFAPVNELSQQIGAVMALVLLAAVTTAVLLARTLTTPLARLVIAAQAVAAGDFNAPVPIQRADEIGQLARAFETMSAAVREREAELKEHLAEMTLLNAFGRDIAATLDLRELARHVVAQCAERFDDLLCGLLLYDEARAEVVAYAVAGRRAQRITAGERTPLGQGLIGQAALARRTQLANDTHAHPDFTSPVGVEVRAEVAVPIIREDKLLGVLVVSSDQVNAFRPDDVLLLETLAAQLAPAIENARLFRDLSVSYDHTLDALVAALDARDKETEGHSRRVVAYTLALARRMNLSADELTVIRRGALLHDIGKIGVPDAILLKPGPLDDAERIVMRRHPEWGERILSSIPFLAGAAQIVCAHQESWDGHGYPQRLGGETIPLGARIFAVADTFDAITSDRPYRGARSYAVARAEIEAGSGTQFDPRVVEVFRQIPEEEWTRLRAATLAPPIAHNALPLWAEAPAAAVTLPELEAFNRLVAAVSGSLDLQEVLREGAHTTVQTLGAAASGLFLYDAESDTLSLAASDGLPENLKARFARFPVAGFHNESVVREGRTRLHGSPAEVPEFVTLDITHIRPEWGAYLCVPIKAKGAVLGVMGLFSRHPRTFDDYSLALYHAMGEQVGLALTNARLYERVQQQALTDSLTGVYNRRYLDDFLSHELKRCARYRHGASLIMLDINRFKEYNDTFGHPAGDEALREVADLLRQHVRAADAVARYGGEEFAVVLPETTPASARTAAEKLRAAIEQYAFPHGQLTASLGVATCGHDSEQGADALIRMADQALYQSKRDGRNRVSLWDAESASLPRQTNVLSS